ncbi:MAG: hypothetical protein K2X39_05895, partial [Silvanigrellaceae bacterium]|nr:hypothetical protein [Silvanigrellaceae bacterium]
ETRLNIAMDIFSASGGIVGGDRFSKALRADSGISYSPSAYFNPELTYPDIGVGVFNMSFQSNNERLIEAVKLAETTYQDFMTKGASVSEIQRASIALQNRTLASEQTIFDRAYSFINDLAQGILPEITSIKSFLLKIKNQSEPHLVNKTIHSLSEYPCVPILVIIGNPSPENLESLKALPFIDDVKLKAYKEIIEELN